MSEEERKFEENPEGGHVGDRTTRELHQHEVLELQRLSRNIHDLRNDINTQGLNLTAKVLEECAKLDKRLTFELSELRIELTAVKTNNMLLKGIAMIVGGGIMTIIGGLILWLFQRSMSK